MSGRARAALLVCLIAMLLPAIRASGDEILDHLRERRDVVNSHLDARRRRFRVLRREFRLLRARARAAEVDGEYPRSMTVLIGEGDTAVARQLRLMRRLARTKARLGAVIDQLTPIKVCPVRGVTGISDDFGYWRDRPPDPPHVHMGNDISASYWSPIVAPFDGRAVVASNGLGGLAVKVYGERGYVYNAHLAAFGTLGYVETGTVIGYVGTSGNATGPHDHFEWHPGNGPAVDPHIYLLRACY